MPFPPGVHLQGGRNAAPVLAALAPEFYAPNLRCQGHRAGRSPYADLQCVLDAWPTLPAALRAGILAMIDAVPKHGWKPARMPRPSPMAPLVAFGNDEEALNAIICHQSGSGASLGAFGDAAEEDGQHPSKVSFG
jgi:hypothetical protein